MRMIAKAGRTWGVALAMVLFLASCAETQFLISTAKRVGRSGDDASQSSYKIGNPYQIGGIWYYPAEDYEYDETGIASWYGAAFHGKTTANGGVYDMNALTAAHRTLPMPSYVRVTNLENGRSLVLEVNDRGPFAKGRIIDISRRGAQLLGCGTFARVRILPARCWTWRCRFYQQQAQSAVILLLQRKQNLTICLAPSWIKLRISPWSQVGFAARPHRFCGTLDFANSSSSLRGDIDSWSQPTLLIGSCKAVDQDSTHKFLLWTSF